MAEGRVYVVKPKGDEKKVLLIRARSRGGALRFSAEKTMTCAVATQDDLIALIPKGAKVEDATEEKSDEEGQQ